MSQDDVEPVSRAEHGAPRPSRDHGHGRLADFSSFFPGGYRLGASAAGESPRPE